MTSLLSNAPPPPPLPSAAPLSRSTSEPAVSSSASINSARQSLRTSFAGRRHSDLSLPTATSQQKRRWSSVPKLSFDGGSRNSNRSRSMRLKRLESGEFKEEDLFVMKKFIMYSIVPCLVMAFAPWAFVSNYQQELQERSQSVLATMKEYETLLHQLDDTTDSLRVLTRDVATLEHANSIQYKQLRRLQGNKIDDIKANGILESEVYDVMEKAEDTILERIGGLEKHLKWRSQRRLQESYGSGPFRVEVSVEEPDREDVTKFVIQLALPVELPYATDHFLKMVEKNLWNGLSFTHGSGSDVVVASMMQSPRKLADAAVAPTRGWAAHRFETANVTSMIFTERSETFPQPHQHKYSVAFSGRPGGPGFYISLEDELQTGHERESTFGVVISGREVLDRFYLAKPKHSGNGGNRMTAMGIVSLRVMSDDE